LRVRDDSGQGPIDNPIQRALDEDEVVTSSRDLVLQTPANVDYAIELTAAPIHDDEGQIAGAVLVFRDVTEMRTLARELGYQAAHDPLTGLLNRREFERHLQRLLDQARAHNQMHALCYIDLDLFKVINDTCGHIAGDELLRQLGQNLRGRMRKSDVLARLGGDEFGVLLENCDLEQAERVVPFLQQAIREFRFVWEDKSFEVAASIGLAPITAGSGSLHDLLRTADLACYAAKDAGRNRIHVARADDAALAERQTEVQWVQRIKLALVDGRFALHGQRIQAVRPGASGERYEILVRLIDDAGRLVHPRAFLPVAERYQLMPAVDRWVLGQSLRLLKDRVSMFGNGLDGLNINLSGQSLGDVGFHDFLVQELQQSGVPPERICFEITETATVANLSRATELLTALKAIGCEFALDDFGSGLSSFAYLKNLPVNYLKIDGAFIRDILHDRSDHAMVASIHQLAHILGIQTVAEYVDSPEIFAAIERIGIDYAQGYGVAEPRPLDELLTELTRATERAAIG
jgi:diguanylate cyclase (GGDEF)-like protein